MSAPHHPPSTGVESARLVESLVTLVRLDSELAERRRLEVGGTGGSVPGVASDGGRPRSTLGEPSEAVALGAPAPLDQGELERRRSDALERLPLELAAVYEELVRAGRRPAFVFVTHGSCTGCHVALPTHLGQTLRHSLALSRCPHCRRILCDEAVTRSVPAGAPPPAAKARPRRSWRPGSRPASG